jgi:hypothetical protein
VSYYINKSFKGINARFHRKAVSISKLKPLTTKAFIDGEYDSMVTDAFNNAYQKYLMSLRNLKGVVRWFDRGSGEGTLLIPELDLYCSVYACNLKGKKTWYSETACVYLEDGQDVIVERLAEVDRGVTPIIYDGVKFDSDKWNSLDHSRLAFKCDDNGNAINGLFADSGE